MKFIAVFTAGALSVAPISVAAQQELPAEPPAITDKVGLILAIGALAGFGGALGATEGGGLASNNGVALPTGNLAKNGGNGGTPSIDTSSGTQTGGIDVSSGSGSY